jgi:DNA polymerase-3 subunit delta'
MARAANCTGTERAPYTICGNCASCKLPPSSHPDITVVGPGESGRIGIDVAREVRHLASLTPGLGRRRFILLDDAHRLTSDAADALLKTLEEPAPQTTLVLIVPQASSIPQTIASRCQEIRLVPVAPAKIVAALTAMGYPSEKAVDAAELAFGRPGWALLAVRDPSIIEDRRQILGRWQRLCAPEVVERLKAAAELAGLYADEGRWALVEDLQVFIGWWRNQISTDLPQAGHPALDIYRRALAALQVLQRRLTFNTNIRLALEAAALELPG